MRYTFQNRLEAIEWIAQRVEDEGQFEVLREQLNYNFIYTRQYYLDLEDGRLPEVSLLDEIERK